ncbi:transglycosylase family protein [Streptomyces sp. NPDC091281]|uniref:transglycosylase family protein n=1 Tax=Streptomyces sp. NPDC091281 TaxID=3365985 RepID=UPI0037F6102F
MTGSAIAIPLLGASGASAADGSVWDKVAECETGGSWSADEGGGEYGGLALSQDDWVAYGGLDYAERADLASRNQQISIAQKLLADQGVGAWGSCAPEAGLTLANGTGALDTGVVDDSGESGSSGTSEDASLVPGLSDLSKGGTGSAGSSGSSGSGKSADPSAESGDPSANPSADEKTSPSSSPSSSSSAKPAPSGSADADDPTASGTPSDDTDTPDRSGEFVQDVGSWSLVDTGSLGSAPPPGRRHPRHGLGRRGRGHRFRHRSPPRRHRRGEGRPRRHGARLQRPSRRERHRGPVRHVHGPRRRLPGVHRRLP